MSDQPTWYPTTRDSNERIREWVREHYPNGTMGCYVPLVNDRDPGAEWCAVVDCRDDFWPVDFRRVPCE